MSKKILITAIVLVKNEATMLGDCLASLDWVDELIVVDSGSTDKSLEIAKKYQAQIVSLETESFAVRRTEGFLKARGEWIFYVDADERIPHSLHKEIVRTIKHSSDTALLVSRRNIFLGTEMYRDEVPRLFRKSAFLSWKGTVHETPQYDGSTGKLATPLLHYTHRDISSMLDKTNAWSEIEADLRIAAGHPPVAWWRLIRMACTRLYQQFVVKKVWRFGRAGIYEGLFQVIDVLIVYTKLWERQHTDQS